MSLDHRDSQPEMRGRGWSGGGPLHRGKEQNGCHGEAQPVVADVLVAAGLQLWGAKELAYANGENKYLGHSHTGTCARHICTAHEDTAGFTPV